VAVLCAGHHDDVSFLVREYDPGPTLQQVLAEHGPVPPEVVRRILVQVAMALGWAHSLGIVHHGVRPSNVLMTATSGAKLMDFHPPAVTEKRRVSPTAQLEFTGAYASPEQALGQPVTAESDFYALGAVGYELLSGRPAFERSLPIAATLATIELPPPPLPEDVPADLTALIERCLAKDPQERPSRASAIVAALVGAPGESQSPPDHPVDEERETVVPGLDRADGAAAPSPEAARRWSAWW
jgi:serine/threonine-protein kinase